ncbi:MAG: hypothetical protein ACI9HK_005512, partial [Pirellulaceae bacterium]
MASVSQHAVQCSVGHSKFALLVCAVVTIAGNHLEIRLLPWRQRKVVQVDTQLRPTLNVKALCVVVSEVRKYSGKFTTIVACL